MNTKPCESRPAVGNSKLNVPIPPPALFHDLLANLNLEQTALFCAWLANATREGTDSDSDSPSTGE